MCHGNANNLIGKWTSPIIELSRQKLTVSDKALKYFPTLSFLVESIFFRRWFIINVLMFLPFFFIRQYVFIGFFKRHEVLNMVFAGGEGFKFFAEGKRFLSR